jgi:hypothetical protein
MMALFSSIQQDLSTSTPRVVVRAVSGDKEKSAEYENTHNTGYINLTPLEVYLN